MRKNTVATLAMTVVLSLFLTACKDTKTLQENEQLKTQVAQLQKDNGELGNQLEAVSAARDALAKENGALKEASKKKAVAAKKPAKKTAKHKKKAHS